MKSFNVKMRIREAVERLGRQLSEDGDGRNFCIEDKRVLQQMLCTEISKLYVNEPNSKSLVLWIDTDTVTFSDYSTDTYAQQLQSYLYSEKGLDFYSVEFRRGVPDIEVTSIPIGMSGKVCFQIVNANPSHEPVSETGKNASAEIARNAIIRIAGEYGSLEEKEYRISADEMERSGIDAYNIGVCSQPKNAAGRRNHIAICGEKDDAMYDRNKYVSRTHAHIGFSKTSGFYLAVDKGGTTLNRKSTHLIRDGKKRTVDNIQSEQPLQDGDRIVLSEAVMLLFLEIRE